MEEQSVSINQVFRERIQGCVRLIVNLNRFKQLACIGAVIAVNFNWANRTGNYSELIRSFDIIYFILPCVAAVLVSY